MSIDVHPPKYKCDLALIHPQQFKESGQQLLNMFAIKFINASWKFDPIWPNAFTTRRVETARIEKKLQYARSWIGLYIGIILLIIGGTHQNSPAMSGPQGRVTSCPQWPNHHHRRIRSSHRCLEVLPSWTTPPTCCSCPSAWPEGVRVWNLWFWRLLPSLTLTYIYKYK